MANNKEIIMKNQMAPYDNDREDRVEVGDFDIISALTMCYNSTNTYMHTLTQRG